jgi:Spo12 family
MLGEDNIEVAMEKLATWSPLHFVLVVIATKCWHSSSSFFGTIRIRATVYELHSAVSSDTKYTSTNYDTTNNIPSLSFFHNLNIANMSNILSERSSNIPVSPEKKDNKDSKEAPKSLEYHRQILESRLKEEKLVGISLQSSTRAIVGISHAHHLVSLSSASQTYVSPSDTIQSPATQKLAAFRTKHLKAWV